MHGLGVLERISELARSGQPFALATVVWRQGPSSSKQGSRAIITADGQLRRLDRRRLRRAGRDPRGEAGHRGRERPAAAARQPRTSSARPCRKG